MTAAEIEDQERVEFYAASVNAWYSSAMERDKSILSLSAGGIGLLLTLLTTIGLSSAEALALYICAIFSFVVALCAVLLVFSGNKSHIQDILSGKTIGTDFRLHVLDTTVWLSFGLGVIFSAVISISAAFHSYSTKENTMAEESKKIEQAPIERKSFNGAANLQPTPLATSTAATTASTPMPATNATSPADTDSSKK